MRRYVEEKHVYVRMQIKETMRGQVNNDGDGLDSRYNKSGAVYNFWSRV